jgi:hypothetical protein
MGLDLSDAIVTNHFRVKRAARGVPWEAVRVTLQYPHVVEPHGGRHRVVRGRLALVVADIDAAAPVLVTLLLRGEQEQWDDDHAASVLGS